MDNAKAKISFPVFKELLKNSFRLTKTIWKEKKGQVILLAALFLIISATPFFLSGSRGLLINELVNIAGVGLISQRLFWLIIALIIATVIPPLLFAVQNYFSRLFWFYLEVKFEIDMIQKRGEIDVAVHENPEHNDLFNRVAENGVWRVQNFLERQFYILQNVVEVTIASVILIFSQWWVFLIILVGTLPELFVEARYGQNVWDIHSGKAEMRRRYWDLRYHFFYLPSIIELKLFQNIPYFLSSIKELFQSFQDEQKQNDRKKLGYQCASLIVSQGVFAFAVVWFVIQVVNGNLLIGTLTFILASIADLRQSLSSLFRNLGSQYQDSLFVSDMFTLLDLKPVIQKPQKVFILNVKKTPNIVFENVSFGYPNAKKFVLKNLSLEIPAGEKLALVGINGAGKTTFVKLLCRFYDPTEGRILVDGHDLRDIDLDSWYHQLGAVFQDYSNYHFTVKEAIAVGRGGRKSSLEKVKEAAQASEADIFIEEWEKGYEQLLGKQFKGGIEPSIGQWQKLALARTFYRDPRILILDEPTSSIDAEAESKIFEKLESLPKDRTVILISHRFSTVRKAEKIVVIENGEMAEFGTHEELLGLNRTYAKLFSIQAKGYK